MSNQISVQVTPDANTPGHYNTLLLGSFTRLTTSDDRTLFGLTDDIVKGAVNSIRGKTPNDVTYNDPTQWGDVFAKYGWPQLQVLLQPIGIGTPT